MTKTPETSGNTHRARFLASAAIVVGIFGALGSAAAHEAHFGGGSDHAVGHDHDDQFYMGAGDDRFFMREGVDYVEGGSQREWGSEGEQGTDLIYLQDGSDRQLSDDGVYVTNGGGNDDFIQGSSQDDAVMGGPYFDDLHGGDHDDYLFADDGYVDSSINGGPGQDSCDIDIGVETAVNCAAY